MSVFPVYPVFHYRVYSNLNGLGLKTWWEQWCPVLHYSSDLYTGHRKTDCNKKKSASMQEHSLLTVHLHIQLAVPSGYNLSTHNSNLRTEKKKFPLCQVNLHMLLKFMSVKVMLVFCPRLLFCHGSHYILP